MNRIDDPAARVLSLGAGVQSSTLAIMAATGDIEPPDFAVFADTQAEPQSVYTWLDELTAIIEASPHPFPVLNVTAGSLEDTQLAVRVRQSGPRKGIAYVKQLVPAFALNADGSVGLFGRRCTADYKIVPVHRAIRDRLGVKGRRTPPDWWVEQWIGISTDEAIRMKPARPHWLENRWPLIDAGMNRNHCIEYMARRGLNPPRSACVFCPFHSPSEWARLQKDEPAGYQRAVDFERRLQSATAQDKTSSAVPYLTRYGVPLSSVDWDAIINEDTNQLDMFGNECEGMCGV